MSAKTKANWQNPELRQKYLATIRAGRVEKKVLSEEIRKKRPPTQVVWVRFNLPEDKTMVMCALVRSPIPPSDGQDIIFECDSGRIVRQPEGTTPRAQLHIDSPESIEPCLKSYAESMGGVIDSLNFRLWK